MADRIRGIEQNSMYEYTHDSFIPPLKVTTVVVSRWIQGDYFDRRSRGVFSMSLITGGNARFTQNESCGEVHAGEIFLAHKGKNQVLATGDAGHMEKISVLAEGPVLDAFLAASGLAHCDVVRPVRSDRAAYLFQCAWDVMKEKRGGFIMQLTLIMYEILMELGQSITTHYPMQVRSAIEFMKRNMQRSLTLREICAHVNLSVRHCTRLFEQHVHMPPMEFFNEQRMALARSMLANTPMTVKEIAVNLGFDDPLYFSARFKSSCGVSPKFFRAQLGQNNSRPVKVK